MPDSIDDLARRWKAQPDAAGAITLCDAIRNSSPAAWKTLVEEVGKLAAEKHAADGAVLLAVGRLYAASDKLGDAQAVLVAAGRVAPRDATVFRLLGEVLLRRGDAERAEKVLERAKQLGANDAETAMWMDRAKVFKPIQAKAGARAVAVEIKNTAVHPVTPHPDLLPQKRAQLPSFDHEGPTAIRSVPSEFQEAQARNAAPAASLPSGGYDRQAAPGREPPREPPPDFLRPPTGPKLGPERRPAPAPAAPPARPVTPPPLPPFSAPVPDVARDAMPSLTDERTQVSQAEPTFAESVEPARPEPVAPIAVAPAAFEAPVPVAPVAHATNGAGHSASVAAGVAASMPTAREVLDSLANAGIFEAREASAGPIVWDRPNEKARKRTAIGLGVGIVVFILGSIGVLSEINRRRARDHEAAEALLATVETDLDSSNAALLPQIEQNIGHAFELDSRSPRAASDWLEERAVKGLLLGGGDLAFEDAVARALEVKVPEEQVAFARVCAFLFQGDTGGAAALMPKWDTPAAKQPLYQVITGATLDHAGDPHAVDRYLAATKLAPNLVVAEILLARATSIDGDAVKAAELARQFHAKHLDRPEGSALIGLAWGRDPARGEQAPPEVADAIAHANDLPLPLRAVPYALQALLAIDKKSIPEAKSALEKGLSVVDDPGMATWLGTIALDTHDEPLIRKAALLAVTFSAVYAPARVLAGRIALLGGHLDEALKATEDLDPTSPDVSIVRAAAAYERADADGVGRALEAVPAEAKKLPVLGALNLASDVLLGRSGTTWPPADAPAKLLEMSQDEAPWSDLVAMDAALDLGLTDVADKILATWKGTEDKPLKAIRLSRLARYENRLDDSDHYSKVALDSATVTPRVLMERVFSLVARNRTGDVGPLLARYPLVLGPSSSWLSAYALASAGKLDEARGRTAQLDFPPSLAPLPFRIMAAVSLGAMKDKKRGEVPVKTLLAARIADPDLVAAAVSLGLAPPPRPAAKGAVVRPKGKK